MSDDKILKYHLKPISIGLSGGILDYNKMSFLARKAMEQVTRRRFKRSGSKRGSPAFTICGIGTRSAAALRNLLKSQLDEKVFELEAKDFARRL